MTGNTAATELRYLNDYAKTLRHERLGNVGILAYWVTPAHSLHVFANGVTFTVIGNSGSEEQSKEQAMALARAILSNDRKKRKMKLILLSITLLLAATANAQKLLVANCTEGGGCPLLSECSSKYAAMECQRLAFVYNERQPLTFFIL